MTEQKIISLKEILKKVKKIEGSKLDREMSFWLGIIIVLNARESNMPDEVFESWKRECEEYSINSALIRDLFKRK